MHKQTYKEKLAAERAAMITAGLISERYPEVSKIEFRMTYYQRSLHQVLMKRMLCFTPGDYAGFHLKCVHDGCANGGYDLASVVATMVKAHKKSASGKLFCRGTNDAMGHASMAYEVNIRYS